MLAQFQKETQESIYYHLISKNERIINLYGNSGCGKTETTITLSEIFKENWKLFYIKGFGANNPPYTTWNITNEVKLFEDTISLSVGIDICPIPLLKFGTVEVNYKKEIPKDLYYNENEIRIIDSMIKKSLSYDNILIIADDFEKWDLSSQKMIKKMIDYNNPIKNKQFHILLISVEKLNFENIFYLEMKQPTIEDYSVIINSKYPDSDINKIKQMADSNFKLAFMYAEYIKKNDIKDLHNVIDYIISQNQILSSNNFKNLSIINGIFSRKDTAFLLNLTNLESEKTLNNAKENHIIDGNKRYFFTDAEIRDYFLSNLREEEKYLHVKFAEYLKNNYPEDYYARFQHLSLGHTAEDEKPLLFEGLQLLLIEYIRRLVNVQDTNEIAILEEFDFYLNDLNDNFKKILINIKENLLKGFDYFTSYNYKDCIKTLTHIKGPYLLPTLSVEVEIMLLLCYIQLGSKNAMLSLANKIVNEILNQEFKEDEIACKACLVLLDVYIDKYEDNSKAREVHDHFNKLIQKHLGNSQYVNMKASLDKKSSLFYPPHIAIDFIAESINHYRQSYQLVDLYMSLCNRSANFIINGNYQEAENDLHECINLIHNNDIYFPSHYKIYNNLILIELLKYENEYYENSMNKRELLIHLEEICNRFNALKTNQKDEVSYVVELNYLAVSLLLSKESFLKQLEEIKLDIHSMDNYYLYFLYNLEFAFNLVNQNLDDAKKIHDKIEKLSIPLLDPFEFILRKRIKIQKKLLNSEFNGDILDYQFYFLKESKKTQDPSYYFYMKGVLYSDLQFLSF